MRLIYYILVFTLFSQVSCTPEELDPVAYMSWMKDESNGLYVSKQVGKHTFWLQYKTPEFESLSHAGSADPGRNEIDSSAAVNRSLQFYNFIIQSTDKKDPAASVAYDESDYQQRLNYLMFDMQQDFILIDGKDTLPCLFYHYERNYNLSASNCILLAFDQKNATDIGDKTLVYHDHILNSGPVRLTIKAAAIKSIPQLKITH